MLEGRCHYFGQGLPCAADTWLGPRQNRPIAPQNWTNQVSLGCLHGKMFKNGQWILKRERQVQGRYSIQRDDDQQKSPCWSSWVGHKEQQEQRDPHAPTPSPAPPTVSPKGLVLTCSTGEEMGQGEVRHLSVDWLVCYLAINYLDWNFSTHNRYFLAHDRMRSKSVV